jgi:hypothetical protein
MLSEAYKALDGPEMSDKLCMIVFMHKKQLNIVHDRLGSEALVLVSGHDCFRSIRTINHLPLN